MAVIHCGYCWCEQDQRVALPEQYGNSPSPEVRARVGSSSASSAQQCVIDHSFVFLSLLSSEEIFDYSSGIMTQAKTRHLKESMCGEFQQVFQLCLFVMVSFYAVFMHVFASRFLVFLCVEGFWASLHFDFIELFFTQENSTNPNLIAATLQTLLLFLNWIPLGYVFETTLVPNLITKVSFSLTPTRFFGGICRFFS